MEYFRIAIHASDFQKGFGLIISSNPHSAFGILAYCLLAVAFFELNRNIRKKIVQKMKKEKTQDSIIPKFKNVLYIYRLCCPNHCFNSISRNIRSWIPIYNVSIRVEQNMVKLSSPYLSIHGLKLYNNYRCIV